MCNNGILLNKSSFLILFIYLKILLIIIFYLESYDVPPLYVLWYLVLFEIYSFNLAINYTKKSYIPHLMILNIMKVDFYGLTKLDFDIKFKIFVYE